MKRISILIIVLTALLLGGCDRILPGAVRGNGNVIEETRQVRGVRGVDLATLGDLTIELGESEEFVIEAEENLLPSIETTLSGGTFIIQQPPGASIQPTRPVRYTLTVTSLESLIVSSSGNITAPSLETDRCEVSIRSSGNITLDSVNCDRLEVSISSSGNLTIESGEATEQIISISSSGAYKAGDVHSQAVEVEVSSSGNATVWAEESLEVNLSSSGNVYYFGRPEVSERNTSSGEVVSRGDK